MSDPSIQRERGKTIGSVALLVIVALYAVGVASAMIFFFGGMTGVTPEGETIRYPPTTPEIVVNVLFAVWPIVAIIGLWRDSMPVLWSATSMYSVTSLILVFSVGYWHVPAVPFLIAGAIIATNSRKSPIPVDLPSV